MKDWIPLPDWHTIDWDSFSIYRTLRNPIPQSLDDLCSGDHARAQRVVKQLLTRVFSRLSSVGLFDYTMPAPLLQCVIPIIPRVEVELRNAMLREVRNIVFEVSRIRYGKLTRAQMQQAVAILEAFEMLRDLLIDYLGDADTATRRLATQMLRHFPDDVDLVTEAVRIQYARTNTVVDQRELLHTMLVLVQQRVKSVQKFNVLDKQWLEEIRWFCSSHINDDTPREVRLSLIRIYLMCSPGAIPAGILDELQLVAQTFKPNNPFDYSRVVLEECKRLPVRQLSSVLNQSKLTLPAIHRLIEIVLRQRRILPIELTMTYEDDHVHCSATRNIMAADGKVATVDLDVARLLLDLDAFWLLESNLLEVLWGIPQDRDLLEKTVRAVEKRHPFHIR